jgi:hypothetical protein
LVKRDLRDRVDADGVIQHHEVKPSRSPAATGVRSVLMPALDEKIRHLTVELGREGSRADSSHVGLGDTDTRLMSRGPMPVPMQAPPAVGFDEVT